MKIAVYDLATGEIKRTGYVQNADKDSQHRAGEGVLINVDCDPQTQRIDPQTKAVIPIPPRVFTLAELKVSAKQQTAARRWEIETGGVTLNGSRIDTDDRSKLLLSSAAEQARDDAAFTAKWKTSDDSWIQLDAPTIIAVYGGVFGHVRACFAREAELCALIDNAAAADDLATLDATIKDFWPAK